MASSLIVEVAEIKKICPHPNGDFLEIAEVKGWDCIVKKDQYKAGDTIVFIPPDALLPIDLADRLEVRNYLGGSMKNRVRLAKLRGVVSYGLIIDNEKNWPVGTDVAEHYKILKYEPPVRTTAGDAEKEDPLFVRYTDIENARNFPDMFEPGEMVVVTEKIDGTQSRVTRDTYLGNDVSVWTKGWYFLCGKKQKLEWKAGSNNLKRKRPKVLTGNVYWFPYTLPEVRNLINYLVDTCGDTAAAIYGEIYGKVRGGLKEMTYGRQGQLSYVAFDISIKGRFINHEQFEELCNRFGVPTVPCLGTIPFDFEALKQLAEGDSRLAEDNGTQQIREGIVVKPVVERTTPMGKRKILKVISSEYLSRKEKNREKGQETDFTDN